MKQLEVQIMGQGYLLTCPDEGETRLLEAVERVDTAMCKIRDAGKVKARDRIAVLASLNLAFELGETNARLSSVAAQSMPSSTSQAIAMTEEEAAEWSDLLNRLDQTLETDGRLL